MSGPTRVRFELGARPDSVDFRDAVYRRSLVDVPPALAPEVFLSLGCPVLDQGVQQSCTGYALATVANALLRRRHGPGAADVSPEMLYAMARRYDEYPGSRHQGSSLRGAVKGWHHHGVCSRTAWENEEADARRYGALGVLTRARAEEASARPLGAYFRVPPRELHAVHGALAEVGVMVATLRVHDGWFDLLHDDPGHHLLSTLREAAVALPGRPPVGPEGARARGVDPALGLVPSGAPDSLGLGLHAIAVIGYDADGAWVQNSLGRGWGRGGIGRVAWDDWLDNVHDAWVVRLGAPVRVAARRPGTEAPPSPRDGTEMRAHVIPVGVDGRLHEQGPFATSRVDVGSILRDELREATEGWSRRRLLFIATSGLRPHAASVARMAALRPVFLAQEVYPILLLWNDGFGARLEEILRQGWLSRQGSGGRNPLDHADARRDVSLEALCRRMGGWVEWNHVKTMAASAVAPRGAISEVLGQLGRALSLAEEGDWPFTVHLAGESSAGWLLAPLLAGLARPLAEGGLGQRVASLTLCAPTLTLEAFEEQVLPSLESGALVRLRVANLAPEAEAVDGFGELYRGSLLQLVSNALEVRQRLPGERHGTSMAGFAEHLAASERFARLSFPGGRAEHIVVHRGELDEGRGPLHGRLLTGGDRVHGLLAGVLGP